MSRVAKSAVITSKADQIMNYIADVKNHPAFIGPLKSITNLKGDPKQPGTSYVTSTVTFTPLPCGSALYVNVLCTPVVVL